MAPSSLAHVLGALVVGLAGCTSVLGLDPPTLASCVDGGCVDGSVRDSGADAPETATESGAAPDASCSDDAMATAADALPPGVRCGGGCFGVTYCNAPNPVCCQHTSDAGVTTYACTASESTCDGYPIVCADDDDCPGSDICCHFDSKTTCDTTSACPSNDLICRPAMPIDCPTGKTCDVPAVNAGVTSPYFLCEP